MIEVIASELTFAAADATNSYDNEPADINGDSMQLYLRSAGGLSALDARCRPRIASKCGNGSIDGWDAPQPSRASWERIERRISRSPSTSTLIPDALDVIVNEMPRGRERRRGQLVHEWRRAASSSISAAIATNPTASFPFAVMADD